MRTTVDRAGRLVLPKELRDAIGLAPGPVDVRLVGNAIQIEVPESSAPLVEDEHGLLVIDVEVGEELTDDDVRESRLGLQQR